MLQIKYTLKVLLFLDYQLAKDSTSETREWKFQFVITQMEISERRKRAKQCGK